MSLPLRKLLTAAPPAGGGSKTATFQAREKEEYGATSYTFGDFTAVTGGTNVEVVLCIMAAAGAADGLSSVSVYGQSASLPGDVIVEVGGSTHTEYIAWVKVDIPSTSTNDIVVTFDAAANGCAIDVYHCDELGTVNATATSTSTATAMNLNVNTDADDFVFAASMNYWNGRTVTWTGVTEQSDAQIENAHHGSTGYATSGVTSETPRTVTSTFSGSINPTATGAAFSIG